MRWHERGPISSICQMVKRSQGGGGCRSQVVKLRRTVKNEKDIEKKEKEGGRNSSPGDQSGAETPKSLAELSFFSRWLF